MVAKSSQEETGREAGEGVEIVKNQPYEVNDPINKHNMPKGQYTCVMNTFLKISRPIAFLFFVFDATYKRPTTSCLFAIVIYFCF
jgi:hypothetical protein